jgi:hypothetical protein
LLCKALKSLKKLLWNKLGGQLPSFIGGVSSAAWVMLGGHGGERAPPSKSKRMFELDFIPNSSE